MAPGPPLLPSPLLLQPGRHTGGHGPHTRRAVWHPWDAGGPPPQPPLACRAPGAARAHTWTMPDHCQGTSSCSCRPGSQGDLASLTPNLPPWELLSEAESPSVERRCLLQVKCPGHLWSDLCRPNHLPPSQLCPALHEHSHPIPATTLEEKYQSHIIALYRLGNRGLAPSSELPQVPQLGNS